MCVLFYTRPRTRHSRSYSCDLPHHVPIPLPSFPTPLAPHGALYVPSRCPQLAALNNFYPGGLPNYFAKTRNLLHTAANGASPFVSCNTQLGLETGFVTS